MALEGLSEYAEAEGETVRPVQVESDFARWPKLTARSRKVRCPLDGCRADGYYVPAAIASGGWMTNHANVEHDRCEKCGRWVPRPTFARHRCTSC